MMNEVAKLAEFNTWPEEKKLDFFKHYGLMQEEVRILREENTEFRKVVHYHE